MQVARTNGLHRTIRIPTVSGGDLLPQDLEAEAALIGSALLLGGSQDQGRKLIAGVAEEVDAADFADERHRDLWGVIRGMLSRDQKIDLILVRDEAASRGLDWLEDEFLMELCKSVANFHRAPEYARIVRDLSVRRQFAAKAFELSKMARDLTVPIEDLGAFAASDPVRSNGGSRPMLTCLGDVEPQEVDELWAGRFAFGKLHLLYGDPGRGKSWLTLDMASRYTIGAPWPDGPANPGPGNVVIASLEDDPGDSIRPRVDKQGGDASKIHIIEGVRRKDGREAWFTLQDLDALREAISKTGARLVIIDPVGAVCGASDTHRNAEVRGLLAPLSRLAAEFRACVILVDHCNKGSMTKAVYRATGSLAFVAAARAAWMVMDDPEDANRSLMVCSKMNYCKHAPGIGFRLVDGVLAWDAEPDTRPIDQLLAMSNQEGGPSVLEEAVSFLGRVLAEGPVKQKEIEAQAEQEDISIKSLRRAKKKIGVVSIKKGYLGTSAWHWELPSRNPEDGQDGQDFP